MEKIDQIFEIFSKLNPNPQTELQFTNNYTLLVAVVLSAQATDISVNKATKELFKVYDSPEKMIKLGEEGLKDYIKTIGLYNAKAINIIALSRALIENYGSQVPDNLAELIKLPGVGRKTANVVLNCAFNKPTIAVDTHVFRVARRIGLATAQTPEKVEEELIKVIPKKWCHHAHHWLILHGRYICKAKKPECYRCPISQFCNYYQENINEK